MDESKFPKPIIFIISASSWGNPFKSSSDISGFCKTTFSACFGSLSLSFSFLSLCLGDLDLCSLVLWGDLDFLLGDLERLRLCLLLSLSFEDLLSLFGDLDRDLDHLVMFVNCYRLLICWQICMTVMIKCHLIGVKNMYVLCVLHYCHNMLFCEIISI